MKTFHGYVIIINRRTTSQKWRSNLTLILKGLFSSEIMVGDSLEVSRLCKITVGAPGPESGNTADEHRNIC